MATDFRERRKEVRLPADAELTLILESPVKAEVRGRLVDISRSGFRAKHSYPQFEPGQQVQFQFPNSEGRAKVMWNRILSDRVETGFLVL